jgi:hypothetical protein
MPPARAPERDGDRRTPWSSSRSRIRRWSARLQASRCPRARATAVSAAAASPPPEAAQARAEPHPLSGRPRGCAVRAAASGERRARARPRGREWRPPRIPPPRPRGPAPATRSHRSPPLPRGLLTAAGTAAGARSSRCDLPHPGDWADGHRRSPEAPVARHVPDGLTSRRQLGPSRVPGDYSVRPRSLVMPAFGGSAEASGHRSEPARVPIAVANNRWADQIGHQLATGVARKVVVCRQTTNTATGIRTRVSAVRERPSIRQRLAKVFISRANMNGKEPP